MDKVRLKTHKNIEEAHTESMNPPIDRQTDRENVQVVGVSVRTSLMMSETPLTLTIDFRDIWFWSVDRRKFSLSSCHYFVRFFGALN